MLEECQCLPVKNKLGLLLTKIKRIHSMELGWGGRDLGKKVSERFGLSLGDLGEGLWKQSFLLDFML